MRVMNLKFTINFKYLKQRKLWKIAIATKNGLKSYTKTNLFAQTLKKFSLKLDWAYG